MSEKVAAHSGVTRHHDSNSATTSTSNPGRVIANRVFVGNIPSNLVERDLLMLFNRFGKIRDVKIIPEHTRNKSYGFVTFFSEADARRAIQASLQNDSVMWGDRKLNVAPAVKKNSTAPAQTSTASTLYQGSRIPSSSFYSTPVQGPTSLYSNSALGVSTPELSQQPPAVDPVSVDVASNGLYQTAVICRLPHQYTLPQCQYTTPANGHYYLTPGFQPYMQTANSPVPTTQCAIAPYTPAMQHMPLTPPGSNTSRDNSMVVADNQSDSCCDSGGSGGDSSSSSQGGGEKHVDTSVTEGTTDMGQNYQATPTAVGDAPYPMHTAYMCCPHHSCMLSPISPVPHLPGQPTPAGLTRSCLSLHAHPGGGCGFPPNSPLIYSSPLMYNTARRPAAARLQRWSSLDANLATLSHSHHHQQMGMWGNESAWSRPSLLDDSYGSETGLYPTPRNFERPLRPAFSCQSHHGGMYSPFCRSYEFNLWGQAHMQNAGVADATDQTVSNSPGMLQMAPSPSQSSMNLNLSEVNTEQIQQSKK